VEETRRQERKVGHQFHHVNPLHMSARLEDAFTKLLLTHLCVEVCSALKESGASLWRRDLQGSRSVSTITTHLYPHKITTTRLDYFHSFYTLIGY
jgi:hypothetical protein